MEQTYSQSDIWKQTVSQANMYATKHIANSKAKTLMQANIWYKQTVMQVNMYANKYVIIVIIIIIIILMSLIFKSKY